MFIQVGRSFRKSMPPTPHHPKKKTVL